jgi:hypothetical protein
MGRIFKVQVNIDDMCAELDTMRQDQHAEWLAGFRAGCRGRVPDGIDGPMLRGAQFGLACHASAEEFRQSRVAGGKARQSAHAQHMLSTCLAHAQHQTQHDGQLSNIQVSNIQKESIEQPISTNQDIVAVAPTPVQKPKNQELFDRFWITYNRKVCKKETVAAWNRLSDEDQEAAANGAAAYVRIHDEEPYRKHPHRYLRGRNWEDDGVKPAPAPEPVIYDKRYDLDRLPPDLRPRMF